jgi:ABC-type nitrate/sulfonate/bicarbonate transport system ATPase subunit
MSIDFRQASLGPLRELTAAVPGGAVIGVIGDNGSGQEELLRLAAGLAAPSSGEVRSDSPRRLLNPSDTLHFDDVQTLAIHHTLAFQDALTRAQAAVALEKMRRRGASVLLVSHEPQLLGWLCDEIWWLEGGRHAAQGDPRETLDHYQRHIAERLRTWGETVSSALPPAMRQGDGRARIIEFEALSENGQPTTVWQGGSMAGVRVTVRFERPVADPVVGILIRTRVGLEVYGTNTELENIKLGPCAAGDVLCLTFRFPCHLCPREYTVTAASHDPDGVWHDWLEDGLGVSVTDTRYTAGVANLRARVEVSSP